MERPRRWQKDRKTDIKIDRYTENFTDRWTVGQRKRTCNFMDPTLCCYKVALEKLLRTIDR